MKCSCALPILQPTCYTLQDLAADGWLPCEREIRIEFRPELHCPSCCRPLTEFRVFERGESSRVFAFCLCGLHSEEL